MGPGAINVGSYALLVIAARYSVGDPSMPLPHLPLLARQTHVPRSQLVHTRYGRAEAMPVSCWRPGPWPRAGPDHALLREPETSRRQLALGARREQEPPAE